jgi:tetratricopeptide (TPR) repeat protein
LPEAYNQLGLLLWDAGQKDEALEAWEMVAEVDPYFSFGLANAAIHFCEAGELTRAQEVVDEALAVLPDDPALRMARAHIWERTGNKDAAIAEYRQNIALNPEHYSSYYYLGELYWSEARFAEADSLYPIIAERWPDSPRALQLVGLHFYSRGEFERAEAYVRRAIQEDRHALYARYMLVRCLYRQEKTPEARAELAEIERIWPKDAVAARYIAWCYSNREGNEQAAEQWYLRGLESVPRDKLLLRQLAGLQRSQGRYSEAAEVLERLLAVEPRAHEAYGELALLRSNLGQWDEAIAAAEAAVDIKPDYSEGWKRLSEAHHRNGDPDKAHAVLDQGLTARPDNARLRHARAMLWKGTGNADAAAAELRENIAVNPGHLDSYMDLGVLYRSLERYAEADSLHLLIAERWPKDLRVLQFVGRYFNERKELERAELYLRRAIREDPRWLWVRYQLAICLHKQERTEEARAEMAELERIRPDAVNAARFNAYYYHWQEKDLEAAEQWYLRGLAAVPGDPDLLLSLARLYTQAGS